MDVTAGGRRRFSRIAIAAVVLVAATVSSGLLLTQRAHAETEVHLTAAGDYGARASTDAVLQKIADLHPDANLALGDFEYGDVTPESAWCNFVKAHLGEVFRSSWYRVTTRASTRP